MKPEYTVVLIAAALAVIGWGIRASWKFTNELAEWRVRIFDEQNGLIARVDDHGKRIGVIERRLGWEGEFGRRSTDV